MNFRRFLKLLIKNYQKNNALDVNKVFLDHGFYDGSYAINSAYDFLSQYPNANGRAFFRIGRAAKKQGKVVDLMCLGMAREHNKDMRLVPFINLGTNRYYNGSKVYHMHRICKQAFIYNEHASLDILCELQRPIIERE